MQDELSELAFSILGLLGVRQVEKGEALKRFAKSALAVAALLPEGNWEGVEADIQNERRANFIAKLKHLGSLAEEMRFITAQELLEVGEVVEYFHRKGRFHA